MTWRYRFLFSLLIISLVIISARLFYWQIVKAQELSLLGRSQYEKFVKLFPIRGEIKTSDGFPIVTNKISYTVFANPREIKDREKTAAGLYKLLKEKDASLAARLSSGGVWVPLKEDVNYTTQKKIEALNLPGIGFKKDSSTFYPEASLAASLIGFVGKKEDGGSIGYYGLEGYYDRLLRGSEGLAKVTQDAFGKPIIADIEGSTKAIDGSSLILSVNRSIQFMAEEKLKKGIEQYGASGGMVGIMDPKTGNIIAMASFPSFSPGNYQDYPEKLYKNAFISSIYEPGSTFKPVVMSSALDAGLIKPATKCPICAGPVSIGGYVIHTWNDKYFKNTNMVDVIQHSDNTGMVYVAQKLGVDRMISYLSKFGIGSPTGIDLQGEVSPGLKPKNLWYPVDLATTGFGQGISVTPIELLDAISAIANEGRRMEPHVVLAVETPEGKIIDIPPKILDKPISSQTAKVMTEILVNAVNKGEASWARLKGYRIAGKTGTASIPIAGHYDPTKTIASFIGFAPADNPKFAMLVIIDKPTASIYGSETAAPIFFSIAKELLSYYGIPPTE